MTQPTILRTTIAVCALGATLALGACSGSNNSPPAPAATSSTSAGTSSSTAPMWFPRNRGGIDYKE